MNSAKLAMDTITKHEIIRLAPEAKSKPKPVVNTLALNSLSSQADETEPYWAVSCLGNTGAGKSFIIKKLLEKLGYVGGVPYSIDYSEIDDGDVTVSVTGNISCFPIGCKLLFDVEGIGGTLPLTERILCGIGDRLRLSAAEKRQERQRRLAVAQFFPPIGFTVSNTVIFVYREPLKNSGTITAIKEFAESISTSSTGTYLVILHNFCPLNQMRLGGQAEQKLTAEFLLAHDEDGWLAETFCGIRCMTFPDAHALDKRTKQDGEVIFASQLESLCKLLEEQYRMQKHIRIAKLCALPARSLITIIPEIVSQIQAGQPVSIPDILIKNLRNNPDEDCQLLSRTFSGVVNLLRPGGIITGDELRDALSLCIGISAHYLAYKLSSQTKAGFSDHWIRQQAKALHKKILDWFITTHGICQAVSPHSYEGVSTPI